MFQKLHDRGHRGKRAKGQALPAVLVSSQYSLVQQLTTDALPSPIWQHRAVEDSSVANGSAAGPG